MDTFTHVLSKKTRDKGDETIVDLRHSKEMLYRFENSRGNSEDSIRKKVLTPPITSPWDEKGQCKGQTIARFPNRQHNHKNRRAIWKPITIDIK